MNESLDLWEWYLERRMKFVPKHFIKSDIILTDEMKLWVAENTSGRYAFQNTVGYSRDEEIVAFEDEGDLVLFLLTWLNPDN